MKFHQDIIMGLGIIGISAFIFFTSLQWSNGAELLPMGASVLFFFFGILIILKGLRRGEEYEGDEERINLNLIKSPLALLFILIIFVFLLEILGFFISSSLFLIASLAFLRVRKIISYVYIVIGLNVFVYLIFVKLLHIRLPTSIFS